MELKSSFYKKFYDKLYRTIYFREFKKEPIINNERYGSTVWTEKISVPNQKDKVFRERYYFDVRSKYFYDRFADAKQGNDIEVDNLSYFKALLYIGFKTELNEELDFLKLFKKNAQRKTQEQDAFSKYCDENLQYLHYTFAVDWLDGYTDETIFLPTKKIAHKNYRQESILEILERPISDFVRRKISGDEKGQLYQYYFNLGNTHKLRTKALSILIGSKTLLINEVINILENSDDKTFLSLLKVIEFLAFSSEDKELLFRVAFDEAIRRDSIPSINNVTISAYVLLESHAWVKFVAKSLYNSRFKVYSQFVAINFTLFLLSIIEKGRKLEFEEYLDKYWIRILKLCWVLLPADEKTTNAFSELFCSIKKKYTDTFIRLYPSVIKSLEEVDFKIRYIPKEFYEAKQ